MADVPIELQFVTNAAFKNLAKKLGSEALHRKAVKKALPGIGRGIVKEIQTKGFLGRPSLERRSGELSASLSFRVNGDDSISILSSSPYMHIQLKGNVTVVRPVSAKALAIPLPSVLSSNGTKLYPSPLGTSTFKVTKRGKQGFLAFRGTEELSHVLRDSVTISGRLDVKKHSNDFMKREGGNLIAEEIKKLIENG